MLFQESTNDFNENQNDLYLNFKNNLSYFSKKNNKDISAAFVYNKKLLEKSILNKWIIKDIIKLLIPLLDTSCKPTEKENALLLLNIIYDNYKNNISSSLINLIPAVSNLFWDSKISVQNVAKITLKNIINCSGNKDLDPFLPIVLATFEDPSTTGYAIEKLAGCVFVQNVECAAITIIEPILNRGLKDKINETTRKTCVIIDNMCKLVEDPKEIIPLIYKIQPLVESCAENISDPEARSVAENALNTLK